MISFNPSAASICPDCHDGVKKEFDRWRTRA